MSVLYHDGNRKLQDEFESRRIADRLEEKLTRFALTDSDKAFIEGSMFFFLATADAEGRPDCSFKGGAPGFVRATSPSEIAFPDYDGNGMFKSLGNVLANPAVGLLSEQRQELNTQTDYDKLFSIYRKSNLAKTKPTQMTILNLLRQHERIALTCFEANICQCHRKHLAEAIEKLPDFNYEVRHI